MNKAKRIAQTAGYGSVLAATRISAGFAQEVDPNAGNPLQNGIDASTPNSAGSQTLFGDGGVFETIANTLLLITGAVSVIMLIVGGFRYVVSGGSESGVKGAKNQILYAIIGLVVTLLAFAIVRFVTGALS